MAEHLSPEEIRRYARHIVLKGVGGAGQQKLKAARVLVVGAGGLGSPVVAYLAAAGVGHITIVDNDTVSLSNLQRQVIHRTADRGVSKADSAARFGRALNPLVTVDAVRQHINPDNAGPIIAGHDIVADGSDNFATRLAVAEACHRARSVLVSGAVGLFDGTMTTIASFRRDEGGRPLPTLRCLYPDDPDEDSLPACEEVGVLGPVTGVIGGLMALEVVKLITGLGEPMIGRLLVFDGRESRFTEMRYAWRADNPLTGTSRPRDTAPSAVKSDTAET